MPEKRERLQKIISAYGAVSRREAERMIESGRVNLNGLPAVLGQSATLEIDVITIDGEPLDTKKSRVYLMLNKPRGYLSTVKDQRNRKNVMELVTDVGVRVYPVGRLDMDSEGLLLFTNDGGFANIIMHPSFNKQKTYEVKAQGDAEKAAALLRAPIEIDGYTVKAVSIEIINKTEEGGTLLITISEGRNRQIRKMCGKCGLIVKSLKRISIGDIKLGSLESGCWRYLTNKEVESVGKGHFTCN